MLLSPSLAFWGKARPLGNVASHPVVAHSLDVAAVALRLAEARDIVLPPAAVAALAALHDIGKFSRPFQALAPALWPAALGPAPAQPPPGPRHDTLGYLMLADLLPQALDRLLPPGDGWTHSARAPLLRAVAGHHGAPPMDDEGLRYVASRAVCATCRDAAQAFIATAFALLKPERLARPAQAAECQRLSWSLAGLLTLADWIGSAQHWFPYVEAEALRDPSGYWHGHALPRADAALAEAGLAPARVSRFGGFGRIFPAITAPTPVQRWAEEAALPDGPVLAVIEDLTGSGKTEAAVTLAHRLLAAGKGEGLFVALPTMATANAMFGRLASAYRALFEAGAKPSLALAHGRAALDPRFLAAILPHVAEPQPAGIEAAEEPAGAQCVAWRADDRRRALLAQVGVGTLDQALLAVLPVRHAPLRLHGLARKVLVVDEVHAFDPYMQRELRTLLEFHAALGGSAILLSATLPQARRQSLADAFRAGLGRVAQTVQATAYPLTTLVSAQGLEETPCAVSPGLERRVIVTRAADEASAVTRIAEAARLGAAVAWVRNTVDDAIAGAAALRAAGVTPMLFHARFAMCDRLAIEAAAIRRFGKDAPASERPGVLVATQVIEQSLDLDFDLLVTDLAPADLLIQRAGRLWRHRREHRPVAGPEMLVLSPPPVEEPDARWIAAMLPGTQAVYRDPALLWRSARAVFGRGAIASPDDMRPLIEEVAEGDVPAALAMAASRAEGKTLSATAVAAQNVLDFQKGYRREAGLWEPDVRTPTRLEDRPQVTLRLARMLRDGQVVPYAEDTDPRRAWALSEVSVAADRVARCEVPPELEQAAVAARAQWGKWERESPTILLAILNAAETGWLLRCLDAAGNAHAVPYDSCAGLQIGAPGLI